MQESKLNFVLSRPNTIQIHKLLFSLIEDGSVFRVDKSLGAAI